MVRHHLLKGETTTTDLNGTKTKDVIIDLCKNSNGPKASMIRGEEVQIADTYKYQNTNLPRTLNTFKEFIFFNLLIYMLVQRAVSERQKPSKEHN